MRLAALQIVTASYILFLWLTVRFLWTDLVPDQVNTTQIDYLDWMVLVLVVANLLIAVLSVARVDVRFDNNRTEKVQVLKHDRHTNLLTVQVDKTRRMVKLSNVKKIK